MDSRETEVAKQINFHFMRKQSKREKHPSIHQSSELFKEHYGG